MGGGNGGFQLRLHMMMFHQAGIVLGFSFGRNSEDAEAAGVLFTKMFSPNPNFRLRSSTNLGHSGFPEMTLRHKFKKTNVQHREKNPVGCRKRYHDLYQLTRLRTKRVGFSPFFRREHVNTQTGRVL